MQPRLRFCLLLLAAVCILSVYSCLEAVPAALVNMQMENTSNYTYHYSMKYITTLQIIAEQATICFYTESKRDEIVVQTIGAALEGSETEKTLKLKEPKGQACQIDIYLPERFYNVFINGKNISAKNVHTMRGSLQVESDYLQAELDGYCGEIHFLAKEGSVSLKNGKLQDASHISLSEKGNIYLDTKLEDTEGISCFSTRNGVVKIQTKRLNENTLFEVSALSVFGTYRALDTTNEKNASYHKAEILSENGLVYFIE